MSPAFALFLMATTVAVSPSEYRDRRAALRKALPDAAILLIGNPDTSNDPRSSLLQEPNFYYLTGWNQPGAVLLLLPESSEQNEVLFLPPRNERKERYEGRRAAAGDPDAEALTGFPLVLSTDIWEAETRRRIISLNFTKIHILTQLDTAETVKRALPNLDPVNAAPALTKLRMVKSPAEISLLQHSIEVTKEAHFAAWKRAKPGLAEYQIAATMTQVLLDSGCERHAYRPVIGSGPNSVILHYGANRRRMDRGEVLLMDVGAECSCYAADITRTIPIGGKFNARQRELYDIVLGAQKAAIAAVKPGALLGPGGTLVQAAKDYMDQHGKPVNGKPLSAYFLHGIGHHIGLEVHDASILSDPLAPGMVITIEPGIYIPEENLGVRIEDMVLVTESGAKVLSSGIPREISDIEKRLAK